MISQYKVIVGLGNIGTKYKNTRHNLGFFFLDFIQQKLSLPEFTTKGNFSISKSSTINLIKPLTYMNASGVAVLAYMTKNPCKPSEILVIHDDLNIANEQIKFKEGGGSGGHNGLKSITATIGQTFHRIRLGIGHPGENVAHFVLENTNISHWESIISHWTDENDFWK